RDLANLLGAAVGEPQAQPRAAGALAADRARDDQARLRHPEGQLHGSLVGAVADRALQPAPIVLAGQQGAVQGEVDALDQRRLARLVQPLDQDAAACGEGEVDVAQPLEPVGAQPLQEDHGTLTPEHLTAVFIATEPAFEVPAPAERRATPRNAEYCERS